MTRKRSNKKQNKAAPTETKTPVSIPVSIEVRNNENDLAETRLADLPVHIDTPRPSLTDWVVIDTDGDETVVIDK